MSADNFHALVFDFETTGLTLHPQARLSQQPRAIEFGAVIIKRDGTIVHEFSVILDPQMTIDPIITKITGLTNDDLRGRPVFEAVLPEIKGYFLAVDVMIAHNLPFDKSILEYELQRLGVEDFPWPQHELCTVQTYVEEWGRRPKQGELYEKIMGKPQAVKHRALDDCKALAEIVVKEKLLEMFL